MLSPTMTMITMLFFLIMGLLMGIQLGRPRVH